MSRLAGDTTQRMREAFTVEMSAATKQVHEASIGDALATVGGTLVGVPTPRWRMRVPALAAALLIVLPVGTAFASEGAVPGDLLYPVKRLVEPIRSVVDSDVVAQHRVDELARLLDVPDEAHRLMDAVTDARDAVGDLPPDHDLRATFDRLTDRVTDAAPVDVPSHGDAESDHPQTVTPSDRPSTDAPHDDSQETDRPGTDAPADGTHDDATTTEPPTDDATTGTHPRSDGFDTHNEEPPPKGDTPPRDG